MYQNKCPSIIYVMNLLRKVHDLTGLFTVRILCTPCLVHMEKCCFTTKLF